mmetsp:Transcript_75452/g.125696  ORF Transcript_75452/g.125696 Transcript_75452/m.125696 type:complete len:84 (-) Transcript_75452:170-421(-)
MAKHAERIQREEQKDKRQSREADAEAERGGEKRISSLATSCLCVLAACHTCLPSPLPALSTIYVHCLSPFLCRQRSVVQPPNS